MKSIYTLIQSLLLLITMSFVLTMQSFASTQVDSRDIDRLFEIRALAQNDSSQGITALNQFQKEVIDQRKNPQLNLEFYKHAYSIYIDADQSDNANASLSKMKALAIQLNDKDKILLARLIEISNNLYDGKTIKALNGLNEISKQVEACKNREVKFYFNLRMAATKDILGRPEKAIEYYLNALKLSDFEPRRKNENHIRILSALSGFYLTNKDYKKALEYSHQALDLAKKIKAKQSTLASLLMTQGVILFELGRREEALPFYQESLKLSRLAKSVQLELSALISINDYYLKEGHYTLSKSYALQTIELARKIQDKSSESVAKINLGLSIAYLGDVKKGVDLVKEGIAFDESSGSLNSKALSLAELADMYEKVGMTAQALETYKQTQKLNDEIFNSKRAKAVSDMQEQFDSEQRMNQISLLEKENNLQSTKIQNYQLQVIVMVLVASLIIAIGIMLFLLYLKLKKTNVKLNEANAMLEFHSIRDPLTALYNRRSFLNLMKERDDTSPSKRKTDSEQADTIILIDLDFFKHINDYLGHSAGDAVLIEVAKRLTNEVRDTDMVIRWGGEEFLIYSRQSSFADIAILAERIINSIAKTPVVFKEESIYISATAGFISIPYSNIPSDACNWEKAMHIADMALYLGKVNGRNRAYGVGDLLVPYEIALPIISTDISTAVKKNMLTLVEILGPVPTQT